MEENIIWKDITGFPGYKISNTGLVWSDKRNKLLKPEIINNGYLRVSLYNTKKVIRKLIHILVLETFIYKCPIGLTAHHKNGNKQDNRINNLEWISLSHNIKYAYTMNLKNAEGENNGYHKLTENQVNEIRDYYLYNNLNNVNNIRMARKFKVCEASIRNVVRRRTWKHVA